MLIVSRHSFMHQHLAAVLVAFLAAAIVSGCHRAKSPAQADEDVATAREQAANKTEQAQQSAESKIAGARADVQSHLRDAEHVTAEQKTKVAETRAEGVRNVSLAACEGLGSDARQSCRDKAEADYQAAKARAERMRASIDPTPH